MSNNVNKYKIICATPFNKEEFKEKSQLALFLDKNMLWGNSKIIYQNTNGLSKVYNSFINSTNKDNYLIFVHDDVLIEDLFFFEKLDIAFSKYDILGLAGSKECNLKSQIPAWHLMSDRSKFVGEVAHSKDKTVWTTVFGPTESRALVLDGLFIAVNVNRLLETNTKFDENFTFHHYDITFCLLANKNRLKLGVYPIKVTHFGLGDSMNSIEWRKSAELFKEIYKNGY
jgi:hypothetical protein